MKLVLVFVGGGLGAAARWGVSQAVQPASHFPWTTFTVNMLGCFLIGMLSYFVIKGNNTLFLLGIVGFLGGFTTFSSFALEMFRLMEAQEWKTFFSYFLVSNLLGVLLVYVGYTISTHWIK
ncbi:MAG: fluoride efflux transporter CrcB [Bacteroidota bacterium]|jgi:CrcB protein